MSDRRATDRDLPPMVFVARGDTPPEEVRGWEKFPATLVLRGGASDGSADPGTEGQGSEQDAPRAGGAAASAPMHAPPGAGPGRRFRPSKRPPDK